MRKFIVLLVCAIPLVLTACSSSTKSSSNEGEKTKAETEQVSFQKDEPKWDVQYDPEEDYDYNGLNVVLEEVAFSTYEDTPQMGIKVKFENKGHSSFEVYPGQADIKLDSGEELSVTDISFTKEEGSHEIKGKGDTFSATYAWNLSYSEIPDIKEVEISWDNYQVAGEKVLDRNKFQRVYHLED